MGKIYLTSDLHFCHDKDFIYEPRGFKCVEDMNETIVKNWNDLITADDDVFILGDCMLNNNAKGMNLLESLNGRLHIITGNHDTSMRVKLYTTAKNVVSIDTCATMLRYKKYNFYLSHYPTMTSNYDDKGLFDIINLCGHLHTTDRFWDMDKHGLIYHVELDAHSMRPVLIDDIIEDIKGFYMEVE